MQEKALQPDLAAAPAQWHKGERLGAENVEPSTIGIYCRFYSCAILTMQYLTQICLGTSTPCMLAEGLADKSNPL